MRGCFEKNIKLLIEECDAGLCGKAKLPLRDLCIVLTNRCNLYCKMCPFVHEDYENKTYHNEKPFMVSFDEFKEFFTPEWAEKQRLSGVGTSIHKEPLKIHFTHGESLLNKDIYEIVKYIHQVMPDAYIRISSNGTVSPSALPPDFLNHIEMLSFSIDGCTKETFEDIRRPAKYEKVMKNLQEWSEVFQELKLNYKPFRISVALSGQNLPELSGIIQLAGMLPGFAGVTAQPLIVDDKHKDLSPLLLENVPREQGRVWLQQALDKAKEMGIWLWMVPSILKSFGMQKPDAYMENHDTDGVQINRYCDYFRKGFLELNIDGTIRELCCNMSQEENRKLAEKYELPNKEPFDIYNSEEFWRLREDMINGELDECCSDCMYGATGFFGLCNDPYGSHIESIESQQKEIFALRKDYIELAQADKEIKRKNTELKTANVEISSNNKKLMEDNAKLRRSNVEISSNNKKLMEDNAKLRRSNVEISSNSKKLMEANAEMSKCNKQLNDDLQKSREKSLQLSMELNRSKQENVEIASLLADREDVLCKLDKKYRKEAERGNNLEAQLSYMMNSFSWKITKPIRYIARLLIKGSK